MQGLARIFVGAAALLVLVGAMVYSLLAVPAGALAAPFQQAAATPDACAPATVTPASGVVNVRTGPGPDYDLVERLRDEEVRPVVGRHGWYQWWQIETADGSLGWVWDSAVVVTGDILSVPVVETGPRPDNVSAPWEPVPDAPCLATPATRVATVLSTPMPPAGTAVADLNANDDGWTAPINLSRSAAASDPQLIVDSENVAHVLWREETVDGFLYTREVDGSWLEPVVVELPFATRRYAAGLQANSRTPLFTPLLTTGGTDGLLHAFWTDDQGVLWHSQVDGEAFETFEAWSFPQMVTEGAAGTVAAVDESGQIHITYVQTQAIADTPAGIYYQQSTDGGATWSTPALLYSSRYLSAIPAEEARVQIAASGQEQATRVLIAWEIPVLEQVFIADSDDGGATWQSVRLVDSRQPGDLSDAVGPSQVVLAAQEQHVLLLWQAGHAGANCQQYYQYSDNAGATWQAADVLPGDSVTCGTEQRLLMSDGNAWLLLGTDNRSYLLAWNGERWSAPQEQETLSTFTNAETFRPVDLGCLNVAVTGGQRLVALGCDPGGRDIWSTSRPLDSSDNWFEESEWTAPALVSDTTTCPSSLQLVSGPAGSLHAFWLQGPTNQETGAIYYSGWDGQRWTPSGRLFGPASGQIRELAVAATYDHQLFVFWSEMDGQIYYSETNPGSSQLVFSAGSWSTPSTLSLPHEGAGAPDVAVDGAGNLYVAYAVQLNEERGIYLTTSTDRGRSWSEPWSVFDGAAAGWQIVGPPKVNLSRTGTLHILWSRQQLAPDGGVAIASLHSTQFRNGSNDFEEAEIVTADGARWYEAGSDPAGYLHEFWQEEAREGILLIHRQSEDDGETWSIPTIPASSSGFASVIAGLTTPLHLLLLPAEREALQQWTWTEAGVVREDGVVVAGAEDACSAAAAVSESGQLVLAYGALQPAQVEGASYALYAVAREVEEGTGGEAAAMPAALLVSQPQVTPLPSPAVEQSLTFDGSSSELDVEVSAAPAPGAQTASDPAQILLISLVPVGFVLFAILLFWRRRAARLS
jgi:SH3-like domain-containing protein